MILYLYHKIPSSIEQKQANAAITIQSVFRGWLTRKKFKIKHEEKSQNYPTFAVGNDPVIEDLKSIQCDENFMFIGISGLRSLKIAFNIMGDKSKIPLIFIVDNSRNVKQFWQEIKSIFQDCKNITEFFRKLKVYIDEGKGDYRKNVPDDVFARHPSAKYPPQDIILFFKELFGDNDKYYNIIKRMVERLCFVLGSWGNQDIFSKINNIKNYHGYPVYLYLSNLFEYLHLQCEHSTNMRSEASQYWTAMQLLHIIDL